MQGINWKTQSLSPQPKLIPFVKTNNLFHISQARNTNYFNNYNKVPIGTSFSCSESNKSSWVEEDIKAAKSKNLRYYHPHNANIFGSTFDIQEHHIRLLIQPLIHKAKFTSEVDIDDFTFITACSSNHFLESNATVKRFRKLFPKRKIVLYDLKLNDQEVAQVNKWSIYMLF